MPRSTRSPAILLLVLASCTGVTPVEPTADARRHERPVRASADAWPPAEQAIFAASIAASAGAVPPPAAEPTFDVVVGEQATRYPTWGRYHGRAHNVERAAELLDGVVLEPGAVLSFNERVGPRTGRAGFRRAPVINGGELTDGIGGGVCQVASTLHAAAWNGGLEMVEYRPHSRPSTYIRIGLDATVAWPDRDLKIRNPFDFPVLVRASAARGRLEVKVLGRERPYEVASELRVLHRFAYHERVVEDPTLRAGTREVSQNGILGARVERTRVLRRGDDVTIREDVVHYPPTDRIVRVGTGA